MDSTQFDPAPDVDEQEWRDTEKGLDARHAGQRAKRTNGHAAKPVRVTLDVELLPAVCTPGYATRVVPDLVLNTAAQRGTLKLLLATLQARGDVLLDGTAIRHPQQALQWLLEKIAVGLPQPVLDSIMQGAEW
jgi:hypothetical protein